MPEITDIKDRKPNPDTIKHLESMLEYARKGELRTVVWLCGWDDDSVTHGWSLDHRNSPRRLIAELTMLQYDVLTNQGFLDGTSVLAKAFEVE